MAITLGLDSWQGQHNDIADQADSNVEDAGHALSRLDGWNHTQLTLIDETGCMLMIGGGPDQYFVQYLLPEDAGEWLLLNPSADDSQTELAIGRQSAPYPNRNLVGKAMADEAIRAFYPAGARGAGLEWQSTY